MGQKLIILHGWGHNKTYWEGFIKQAQAFSYIPVEAIDLPGFGDEPLISADWGIPEYAEWVNRKIAETTNPGDKVILLGHSFGGRISSYIAAHNPEWLRALILYGAPSLYRPDAATARKIAVYKTLKRIVPSSMREHFYSEDLKESREVGMEQIFRNVVTFDQTAELPHIKVPTILIWGEHDDAVPLRIAQEMNHLIPNSTLRVIPDMGHNAHLENPVLFHGMVRNFIQNLE